MGLRASVSVPLHAGRGYAVAVLNVYSHDRAAMAPLIAGIALVHDHPNGTAVEAGLPADLDDGGRELVAAYTEALAIRTSIRITNV